MDQYTISTIHAKGARTKNMFKWSVIAGQHGAAFASGAASCIDVKSLDTPTGKRFGVLNGKKA